MPTWVRLRDLTTGHEFDAAEVSAELQIARGVAEEVSGVPRLSGPGARPRAAKAKPHTDLAGQPRPRRAKSAPAEEPADQDKE